MSTTIPRLDKIEILKRGYLSTGKPYNYRYKTTERRWLFKYAQHNEEARELAKDILDNEINPIYNKLGFEMYIKTRSRRVHFTEMPDMYVCKEDVELINKTTLNRTQKRIALCLIAYARAQNVVEINLNHISFYAKRFENNREYYLTPSIEITSELERIGLIRHSTTTVTDLYGDEEEYENYYWVKEAMPDVTDNVLITSTLIYDITDFCNTIQFTKVCECCGKEFPIAYHSRTKKCPDCYKQYRRDYKTQKQREYRK